MLTIAVSSRSLFQLEEANTLFESHGQEAYDSYMEDTADLPLEPGPAFPLVSKLLALNSSRLPERPDRVEVVLLSRNSAAAGLRVMNSVHAHGLDIEGAVFTHGGDRFAYASALGADLFLCTNPEDARRALANGVAAASILPMPSGIHGKSPQASCDGIVRIAFDGDSVLFSDEADKLFIEHGLARFREEELRRAQNPLGDGPFKRFLVKLHELRCSLPKELSDRISIGLITSRGLPSHGRPLHTLRSWGVPVDEVIFCAGRPKGPLVRAFGADILFDDTGRHIESAREHGISAGHVITGASGGIVLDCPGHPSSTPALRVA